MNLKRQTPWSLLRLPMTWHPYVPGHLQSQQWPKFCEYKYSLYHALLTVKSNSFVIQQKRKYHCPRDITNQLELQAPYQKLGVVLAIFKDVWHNVFGVFFSSLSAQAVMLISLVLSSLILNLIIASWVNVSLRLLIYWFTVLAVDELGKRWRFVDGSLVGGTFDENVTGCDWDILARYTTFQKFIINECWSINSDFINGADFSVGCHCYMGRIRDSDLDICD